MSTLEHVKRRIAGGLKDVNRFHLPGTRLGLARFGRDLIAEIQEDHLGAYAGNLTYRGLFALFPFLVFLLSLLGVFHATSLVNALLTHFRSALPPDAYGLLRNQIVPIAAGRAGYTLTLGAILSIGATLWGVSGGFRALMEALNMMYDVEESRTWWRRIILSLVLSLSGVAMLLLALVLLVFGPRLAGAAANLVGAGQLFAAAWAVGQWLLLLLFVLLAFALTYQFAPNVEQHFRLISPGSAVALVLWIAFSLLFSLYVDQFSRMNTTYGSLAGLAVLLLYMYYSSFIVLLGAEINFVIQKHTHTLPRRKGEPADSRGDTEACSSAAA